MTIVIGKASVPDLQDEIEKCLKKKVIIIDTNQYERGGFESTVDEKGNSKKEFQGKTPFTTRHALEREKATIELMNKGKGACNAIITKKRADELLIDLNDKLDEKSKLNEGQLEAAKAILTSKDRIHGIQGYAGTGKTYMLSKVTEILHKVNEEKLQKDPKHIPYQLQGLAPSGAAVKELQKVGIKSQTIQSLTAKYAGYAEGRGTLKGIKEEREKFVNKIFVTDEASMVDAAQMQDFMVISSKLNIRSALMGDIRQLPAVGAGRPAYEMQRQGMSLVKMTEIRRQENKVGKAIAYSAYARDFHGIFEKVGSNLVDCSVLKERTVKPGKEVVVNNSDTALAAAKLYFTFDKQKREGTLMVAQSNNTKDLVNEFVRTILINKNELGGKFEDRKILVNENPTIAERELSMTYKRGQIVLFNKGNKNLGIEKNEYFEIKNINQNILELKSLNHKDKKIDFDIKLSKSYRKHVELYRQEDREFRINDKVMFTRKIEDNSIERMEDLTKSEDVTKETDIVNSTLGVVQKIDSDSYIIKIGDNNLKIKKDSPALKHLDYSYCRTTHKAQGATENTSILITESWYKNLTEERNFLVQATRHKDDIYMVIDNKESVIETILKNQNKNNDSSIDFLAKDSSFLKRIELSQSLFKVLGGDEEHDKYKIAFKEGENFDVNKEFKALSNEKINPELTLSENIKKEVSAIDLILNQKDKEISTLEKKIQQIQKKELGAKQQKTGTTKSGNINKPKYTAKNSKKPKYLVPEFSTGQIQEKFKEAIYADLKGSDFANLDQAIDNAFSNLGQKQYFGKNKKGEIKWYGKAGYAKDYKVGGEPLKWGIGSIKFSKDDTNNIKFKEVSKEQIKKERQEQALKIKTLAIEKRQAEEQLSKKATKIYSSFSEENRKTKGINNQYLAKKGLSEYIQNKDIKFKSNGDIIIPVKDIDGKIWTLQTIEDSGKKRKMFMKALLDGAGGKKGNFFLLNDKNLGNGKTKNIILAEGFATAASVDKAINSQLSQDKKTPIAVCFDAGNLENSLKNIKSKYPNHNYIIAADDDSIKGKGNTGLKAAITAAEKYGAKVISPKFIHLAHREKLSSDFNDLHMVEGVEKVREQFADKNNYTNYEAAIDLSKSSKSADKSKTYISPLVLDHSL